MTSSVAEFIRREVPDWDDEVIATARFKAFSGQRSDWEPRLLFWKDLILKVARHLGVFIIQPSQVMYNWFNRGGLTPLCIEHVLLEMHKSGEIIQRGDLLDPTSGRVSQLFKRVIQLTGVSRSSPQQVISEDQFILTSLLQESSAEVVRFLSESYWTSFCVITLGKFQKICKGPNEASAILGYLSGCGKVRYFSISKKDFIEGIKVSLAQGTVPSISNLDCDVLHLTWTTEKLQQQLDVIDQRWEMSRKSALASLRTRNKDVALRYAKQLKLASESREKCTSLLNRVEEVLNIIALAESTKKVAEAIQIGAHAIKENAISVEDVQLCLEELDNSIASQKIVEEIIESNPLQHTGIEDDDIEEEFKKLELELGDEISQNLRPGPFVYLPTEIEGEKAADSLSNALSVLKLTSGAVGQVESQESAESVSIKLPIQKLEAA
ncbi:hypothetical protein NE237_016198 [Protea cynaroides]|uniref:Charged multivesicular body protein 7 n=1 Tax=Protea cynaroides TaxID=273540 RepID=A0A9Q0KFE0_9MAGN|nr:hypothetical protein NE237_016198 [Protea cynaroides]